MTDTQTTAPAFKGWAILELMGHRVRPGYVKEVEIAGGKMMRVDIPIEGKDHVTEFYGCAAIYALRPASEQIVKDSIERSYGADPRPVRPVDYKERTQITGPRDEADQGGDIEPEDDEHPF